MKATERERLRGKCEPRAAPSLLGPGAVSEWEPGLKTGIPPRGDGDDAAAAAAAAANSVSLSL